MGRDSRTGKLWAEIVGQGYEETTEGTVQQVGSVEGVSQTKRLRKCFRKLATKIPLI